ncbi:MAG: hypothetical protein ACLQUY_02320 [Ktedonobacterales bacterium]
MSILSPESPMFPLVSPQVETTDDRIVVTYLDSNYLWKDYVVEPRDAVHRRISVSEQEISCVIPEFWSHISPNSHIKHVGCTVNGQTFQLVWPPAALDLPDGAALTFHVLLHEGLDDTALTYARW